MVSTRWPGSEPRWALSEGLADTMWGLSARLAARSSLELAGVPLRRDLRGTGWQGAHGRPRWAPCLLFPATGWQGLSWLGSKYSRKGGTPLPLRNSGIQLRIDIQMPWLRSFACLP